MKKKKHIFSLFKKCIIKISLKEKVKNYNVRGGNGISTLLWGCLCLFGKIEAFNIYLDLKTIVRHFWWSFESYHALSKKNENCLTNLHFLPLYLIDHEFGLVKSNFTESLPNFSYDC